jgi:hypothetical protein
MHTLPPENNLCPIMIFNARMTGITEISPILGILRLTNDLIAVLSENHAEAYNRARCAVFVVHVCIQLCERLRRYLCWEVHGVARRI